MPAVELWHVNVFSRNPFGGNPAAVGFCDGTLDGTAMQSIARIMNLSETVFVSPAQDERADYRARIFTTRRELRFAGHPTIAAAFAFLEKSGRAWPDGRTTLRQECGIGIVEIEPIARPGGTSLFVAQRDPTHVDTSISREDIARALGCGLEAVGEGPFAVVSTGVPWLMVELATLESVRKLAPDFTMIGRMSTDAKAVGMTVFTRQTSDPSCHAHLRSFAPAEGIYEDPVCGSCHGALAAHLSRHCPEVARLLADGAPLRLEQGEEIGLPGRSEVFARTSAGTTRFLVGGESVVTLKGTLQC